MLGMGLIQLVTANTRGALLGMSGYVEPEKPAFVPNPLVFVNGNGGEPASPSPSFLTVGRLVRDKAHDILLDAFALASDDLDGWRLAIALGSMPNSSRFRPRATAKVCAQAAIQSHA